MKRMLVLTALMACGDDAATDGASTGEKDTSGSAPDAAGPGLLDARLPEAEREARDAEADAMRPDATRCAAAGARCDTGACCDGTACVTSSEAPYAVCAPRCAEASECTSGCCIQLAGTGADRVCAPVLHCQDDTPDPTAPLRGVHCFGATPKVFGSDGAYLGDATASPLAKNGVCNFGGPYGEFSAKGALAITSDAHATVLAFSAVIKCDEDDFTPLAYVSAYKGASAVRVIDPDVLCQVLERSDL